MSATATDQPPSLKVEVIYALPDVQHRVTLRLACGSSVRDAVLASGLAAKFESLAAWRSGKGETPVGIFSKLCDATTPLEDGDRVELYRPISADPKAMRRQRAEQTTRK